MTTKKTNDKKKTTTYPLNTILVSIIILISVFNMITISSMGNNIDKISTDQKELLRPADVEITTITADNCAECNVYASTLVDEVKKKNVNVVSETTVAFNDASELISKHEITKLPAVIITGELAKNNDLKSLLEQTGTNEDNNIYVSSVVNPPYYDVDERQVKGQITATLISDSTCSDCADVGQLIDNLQASGISIEKTIKLDYTDDAAKSLISIYNIETVPALILSSDASEYTTLEESWAQLGTVEKDGSYVLRMNQPPFRNVSTGNIDGQLTLTYIVDETCDTCYDVTMHKQILTGNFGVVISNEVTHDITSSEGIALIEKYNITNIPTVVLSKDADAYTSIKTVWGQVGTIEADGSYVFRVLDVLGQPYKNIETGEMVVVATQ